MNTRKKPGSVSVGIVAMAHHFPPQTRLARDVFQEEGVKYESGIAAEIGIEQVRIFDGEWKSDLALAAAKECISRAGLRVTDIDVIVDFSVLPQDYVVPSWCMSNKIQHELGAKNAFNLGFGGGGTTNLLVALKFVSSLIKSDEDVNTALLIASDVSIPGNRVINPHSPMTILGDGASAVIVTKGSGTCEILGTELWSDGHCHDVFYIPGGGLAHPDRFDLYGLKVRSEKYSTASAFKIVGDLSQKVLQRSGVALHEVANFIGPNVSAKKQTRFAEAFGFTKKDPFRLNRQRYGHVQATDLVINLSEVLENRGACSREFGLVCSDGWGFLSGAMLIK